MKKQISIISRAEQRKKLKQQIRERKRQLGQRLSYQEEAERPILVAAFERREGRRQERAAVEAGQ